MKLSELVYLLAVTCFVLSLVSGCKGYKPVGGGGNTENPQDPQDPEDPEDPEDPNKINYKKINETVLRAYCLQCHNSQFPFGGVDLSSYEKAASLGERLCSVVTSEKMPPAEVLPKNLQSDLCEWVSSGFPRFSSLRWVSTFGLPDYKR